VDIGIYVNIFVVEVKDPNLQVVIQARSHCPSLKELRTYLRDCHVYALGNLVYGYGQDLSELKQQGFEEAEVDIYEVPQLTARLILEGFSAQLQSVGYNVEFKKYRHQAFDLQRPLRMSIPEVILYQGCSYNSVFLKTPIQDKLVFGLVIDLSYRLELKGNPASYREVRYFAAQKYGNQMADDIMRSIRIKIGDLTPSGFRNTEAARLRFERIRTIIQRVGERLQLPTGNQAVLSMVPTRVVMEVY